MTFVTFTVLVFMATFGVLNGNPTRPINDVMMSSARLVKVDSLTGQHISLHKHDIENLDKDSKHDLVLIFDNGWSPLAMRVSQSSIWNGNSVVVVRRGQQTTTMPNESNGNCFLHGKTTDPVGAVSINWCGQLSGSIQTPGYIFEIEELDTQEPEDSPAYTTFKVTKRTQEPEDMGREYEEGAMETVKQKIEEAIEDDDHSNETLRVKRRITRFPSITVEMAIHLDAHLVDHLYYYEYLFTEDEMKNWVLTKWNTIQGIFSDREEVGAEVTIAVKLIEIWWENPEGYPTAEDGISARLSFFCDNTPQTEHFDTRALYTKDVGDHIMGLARVGGTCDYRHNCFLIKSITSRVRTDVHEFGHSIGFPHDPNFNPGCGDVGGFMGWDYDTLRYLPCYRKKLRRGLRDPSGEFYCLFEENVPDPQMSSTTTTTTTTTTSTTTTTTTTTELPPTTESSVDRDGDNNDNNDNSDLPPTTESSVDRDDNNDNNDNSELPPTTESSIEDVADNNDSNNNDNNDNNNNDNINCQP